MVIWDCNGELLGSATATWPDSARLSHRPLPPKESSTIPVLSPSQTFRALMRPLQCRTAAVAAGGMSEGWRATGRQSAQGSCVGLFP